MRNLRNFGITLAVSLVVLAIAALFACGFVADTVGGIFTNRGKDLDQILTPQDTGGQSDADDRMTREINGESFTWLWAVSDFRPEVFDNYYPDSASDIKAMKDDFGVLGDEYRFPDATSIVLVRADVETREYTVMTIPSMARVSTPAGNMSLGRVYALWGAEGLCEKVGSMTGLDIEYCTVIHSTDLPKLANTIGSITMTLPVDIYTDGKNYVSAPPEETTAESSSAADSGGKKVTDGKDDTTEEEEKVEYTNELDRASSVKLAKKLPAALLYRDDSDGIDDEMTILQSFAAGVMANLKDASDSELSSMITGLNSTFVYNNVTSDSVILSGEVVRAYSWFEVNISTYPGKFVKQRGKSEAYYNPDIENGVSIFYGCR